MTIGRASRKASQKLDQVLAAYQCHDHQHAIAILTNDYPKLLSEICDVLLAYGTRLRGRKMDTIIKHTSRALERLGWMRRQLVVRLMIARRASRSDAYELDYVKGEVACVFNTADRNLVNMDSYLFREVLRRGRPAVRVVIGRRSFQASASARMPLPRLRTAEPDSRIVPTLYVSPLRYR